MHFGTFVRQILLFVGGKFKADAKFLFENQLDDVK
jgi:hypothetical protein